MAINALHVGDLHFWEFPLNPIAYLGKRALGVGNLALRRARKFRQTTAPHLVGRLRQLQPDWLLFSGDFTTTALDREFRSAIHSLSDISDKVPGQICAVPGNHDRYTRQDIRAGTFEKHLGGWCEGGRWPYFRNAGDGLWIGGFDFTTSNGLGSHGIVRAEQLEAMAEWFQRERASINEFWAICHFPAEEPPGVVKDRGVQLRGREQFVKALGNLDVPVLFLHGHHHHRWAFGSPSAPNVKYLNAGAPMMRRSAPEPDLGFLQLQRDGGVTHVSRHTRNHSGEWSTRPVELPRPGEYMDLQSEES